MPHPQVLIRLAGALLSIVAQERFAANGDYDNDGKQVGKRAILIGTT